VWVSAGSFWGREWGGGGPSCRLWCEIAAAPLSFCRIQFDDAMMGLVRAIIVVAVGLLTRRCWVCNVLCSPMRRGDGGQPRTGGGCASDGQAVRVA
jgi:hypothetical protein